MRTRKDLELKFRNVHALIKKNRPISDITWLSQLNRAKGLDHSKTYDNMTAATCDGASTFLNFNSRSFLVCSLRAMTVL
jgi:hypothetical protein